MDLIEILKKNLYFCSKQDKLWIYIIYRYYFTIEKGRKKLAVDDRKSSINSNNNVIQNIIMENREKLSISGVLDVLSFDDQIVILETELGLLTVKGEDLRINKLSLDTTEVVIEGEIINLGYSERENDKKVSGILNKIFK